VRLAPPIVEITGDDQRRVFWHSLADTLAQRPDLPLPPTLEESEVHIDAMEAGTARSHLDLAMKHATTLELMRGDVLVLVRDDRESRQHGVAMMAVTVDDGFAVGDFLPDLVGDEFVLRLDRPVLVAVGVPLVDTLHFLQKHDVGIELAQLVAQLVNHHPPLEVRKAFVDVIGGDGEAHGGSRRIATEILTGSGRLRRG
jgi:hypothetical protein